MDELIELNKLLEYQQPVNVIRGIYFLLKDNEVVYVGQSVDVIYRVHTHYSDLKKSKDFDSFCIISCQNMSQDKLNNLEAEYIVKFKPIYNITLPQNDIHKTPKHLKKVLKVSSRIIQKKIKDNKMDGYLGHYDIRDFAGVSHV